MAAQANYEKIDQLVFEYQQGSDLAAYDILDSLASYMDKYISLLKSRDIDYTDLDTRRFLSLFTQNMRDRTLLRNKDLTKETKVVIQELLYRICNQLEHTAEEDLKQDICSIILLLAKRYKYTGETYYEYLQDTFRYEMKQVIDAYIYDPSINYVPLHSLSNEPTNNQPTYYDNLLTELDDELDLNWVQGITCGEEFQDLSQMERLIIKMYYHLDYSDSAIADLLGVHKNTVFQKRQDATSKIKIKGEYR